MTEFKKISVIGLGLIASAICRTIRQKDPTIQITGYDSDKEVRNRAKKIDLCEIKSTLVNAVFFPGQTLFVPNFNYVITPLQVEALSV